MRRPASTRRHRTSLPARLCAALAVGAVFVAALLGLLGADRKTESLRREAADLDLRFAQQFADRAAPLLDRGDLLRLSMLATAGRDLHGARVLVLERSGRVVLDTGLVLGDRSLSLLAHSGVIQRMVERDGGDGAVRETIAPVRFGGEVMGEVRLQQDPTVGAVAFDLGLFGLVLLGGSTLVAVAWLLAQHWSSRIRSATSAIAQIASGQPTEEQQPSADREIHELGLALSELERGVHDGLHRVVEPFLDVAMQVVEGLERRGLVPEGRGLRTSRYATLLADRLDLQPLDRRDLDLACRLADFGRAWIRPSLLQKKTMSVDEQQLVRSHPALAAERLECLPGLRDVAQIVRCQAERYDGGGPTGLRGERIPIASRILAIAGAFDLWTTCGDPSPLGREAALRRMAEDRGEAYDPWLLDLFAEVVRAMPKEPTTEQGEDKAVMILPAGGLPAAPEREEGLDYALGAELDVMLEELPPEDKA
jgi:HD domain